MAQEQWTAVDRYITDLLVPADPVLESALTESAHAGLPAINVAPNQGKLLYLLARMLGARKILEVGTLGGYSTIWLGRALRDSSQSGGRLITLELEAKHAEVARANVVRAGLGELVEVRVGRALETLPQLEKERVGPFDMVFIDADKVATAEYFEWAVKLARVGSVIVVDNVVRSGAVIDKACNDASVQGVRRFYELMAKDPRVSATAIQTVGSKGHDGFAMAVVIGTR